VLVLTLILVTVMAVVVIALAQYVTVALTTSDVASERTETNADAASAMNWAIEQFAKKQLRPDDSCGAAPSYLSIAVPSGLASNGTAVTLECRQTNPITGEPVVHLVAMSTGVQERMIQATIEVPRYSHGARISDWRVDIPIAVPDLVTTTTSSTTTTTVAPGPNTAPSAADMSMSVDLDAPFVVTLPAVDAESDPLSVSNLTVGGTELDVTHVSGLDVTVTAVSTGGAVLGGTYTFSYTVDDTEPSTSNAATVTVIVNDPTGGPTTTSTVPTTTVPPMPSCTFVVTSAHQNGKSGRGTLTVSNSGSDFTGWQIRLDQESSSSPWQFTWGDPSLTVTSTSSDVTVAGSQIITQTTPYTVSADLTQSKGSGTIHVNDVLNCQVLAP
jgi:hypothetical protein